MLENEDIGSIEELLKIISRNCSTDFTRHRQQDAAEFMTRLLDCLYNSVLEREKQEFTMLFKTENEKKRTCTVSNIYGCQTVNDIEELDIRPLLIENPTSLEQCMTLFHGIRETITVNCSNFSNTTAELTNRFQKIASVLINIPLRYQHMHSGDWYILTGILQQKGESKSDHYVAFTRNILDRNINFIHSNDHAPLETRSFEEVSYDLNCSYMFMYTHEDCLQEARTMLTDMTIDCKKEKQTKRIFRMSR